VISLDRVSKGYGPVGALLTDVSLGLGDSDRVGVVGLNGAGKSTLLRLLTKAEEPDAGRVAHRRDLRVLSLPQTLDFPPEATVGDIVLGQGWLAPEFAAEHEWAGDAAVRNVLTGLGMPDLGLDTPVGPLSGGERRRVALAALLVRSSDVLVLDEPTNHLDIAGIDWLAAFLRQRSGALVVVTHDRWFLDAVCDRTWEVADETVRSYDGGYAAWVLARAERERLAAAAEARRQNLLRKEIAWLRRGPPARTSKPKFRIEAANALIADVPQPRDTVSLRRLATARLGKQVYELSGATVRLDGRTILSSVDWLVGPGDRIGIVGPNGAGKSTLLRVLAGRQPLDQGTLRVGPTVRPAFLSQELDELPRESARRKGSTAASPSERGADRAAPARNLRVLEAVEEVARRVELGGKELSAAQLAEVFGFSDRRLWTPVRDLSGGERRRLQLLRLLAGEPNVLLLDEPTNDLDTDTLASLEDLLDTWPGTLIVASHDRYLVERVCDAVYTLPGDGSLRHLPGGIDEYLALMGRRPATAAGSRTAGSAGSAAATKVDVAGEGGASEGPRAAQARRAANKELARLERVIARLEQREAELAEQLAAHATDYVKLAELDAELRQVRAEREAAETRWLEVAEAVG
jgi:ATPase subunit of ABC transporter with duplicated ATPase domains